MQTATVMTTATHRKVNGDRKPNGVLLNGNSGKNGIAKDYNHEKKVCKTIMNHR
jgi:hypothetical protein